MVAAGVRATTNHVRVSEATGEGVRCTPSGRRPREASSRAAERRWQAKTGRVKRSRRREASRGCRAARNRTRRKKERTHWRTGTLREDVRDEVLGRVLHAAGVAGRADRPLAGEPDQPLETAAGAADRHEAAGEDAAVEVTRGTRPPRTPAARRDRPRAVAPPQLIPKVADMPPHDRVRRVRNVGVSQGHLHPRATASRPGGRRLLCVVRPTRVVGCAPWTGYRCEFS